VLDACLAFLSLYRMEFQTNFKRKIFFGVVEFLHNNNQVDVKAIRK
jgi:hypothetical protein